jgi:alpha-L-fucosidase 2
VDQVIVVHLSADRPNQISFTATMTSPQRASVTTERGDTLVLRGQNGDAFGIQGTLKFEARAKVVLDGGKALVQSDRVVVRNANRVLLLIAAATSYRSYNDTSGDPTKLSTAYIQRAQGKPFTQLRDAHIKEHQRLFRRVDLNLGLTEAARLPTNLRPAKFLEGEDPQLAELYFQYGRYLLISSSRPGTQPANLQGLWNESMTPPWESKYTININTEMNYWPAETTNLSECHEPLTRMVTELVENGSRTARGALWSERLGLSSQHRPLACNRTNRWSTLGLLAHWRRVVMHASLESLRIQWRSAVFAPSLSRHERVPLNSFSILWSKNQRISGS